MIQSKAVEILRELNKKEFLQFGKYLQSAVFVSNKNLPKLYNFLKRFYPLFSSGKLSKENIYRSVYGSALYNDTKTRKLLSDIYKEVEKFIVIKNVFSRKKTYDKILLEEFDSRKLDNLFISKYEDINSYLDKSEKHYEYYLDKYLLEASNVGFHLNRGMQYKIALNIYTKSEYLIFLFLSELFVALNDIKANKHTYNIESGVNLAEAFISDLNDKKLFEYIDKNNFHDKGFLYICYLGYLASRNLDDEKYYYNLKDFALKNLDKFREVTQKTIIVFLMNYCIQKLGSKNKKKFQLELNGCHKLYIKYKLYKISGENYIRSDVLLNILSNYFAVGKITEAGKFLEDNIEIVLPSHKKNMFAISNALIQFEKGNFGESLRQASLIKSNTLLYKFKVKILTLKNHYEFKNFETAKEFSNNYRNFLNENKNVSEPQKERGLIFLHYYNLLLKIQDGKIEKFDIRKLKNELIERTQFPESDWIIKKVDELVK